MSTPPETPRPDESEEDAPAPAAPRPDEIAEGAAAPSAPRPAGIDEATAAPTAPRRRGMLGSARNMVLSMAVVVGICLALVVVMPQLAPSDAHRARQVDVTRAADDDAAKAKWDVSVPVGLASAWEPKNTKFGIATDSVPTWHVGYKSPTNKYVALEEGRDVSTDWLAGCAGKETGEKPRLIKGQAWVPYQDATKNHFALVRKAGDVTTVVSGPTEYAELAEFAGALAARPKASAGPTAR